MTIQARLHELREWIHAYTEWKEWFDKWKGKREPGWFGARERRTKPDPPAWLSEYCRVTPVPDGDFAIGCELLADWREDPVAAAIKERIRSERANREAQTRTQWWSRIHIDALWLTPQVPTSYGVIGVHVALKVAGRFHLFAAPGAMLLNLPARDGTREWKPATDLGLSYQLVDFTFPGHGRTANAASQSRQGLGRGKPQLGGRFEPRPDRLLVYVQVERAYFFTSSTRFCRRTGSLE